MSIPPLRLQTKIEKQQRDHARWQQTLKAMESAAQGKVVDSQQVHDWLDSWGQENELNAPKGN